MSATQTTSPIPLPTGASVWPVILLNQPEVSVGRGEGNSYLLAHASISRNHLKLVKTPDNAVEIEDLDSRFGTFVNGARIKKSRLKVGDTVRIGASPPYRFNGQQLEVVLDGSGMAVKMSNIGIEREGRKLIDNFNLTIPADNFVGVLGPSGAGKSLMLGTLSSTLTPSTGEIEFDDGLKALDNLDYYRSKIGIVTQDDLVYTDLTVQENLDFAAIIRLPAATLEDRAKRVDFALDAVGLLEHRVKRVGVLSGGQRKRVSVAVELLLQPRLLLLDEPTSGLDPGMQARLMEMLRGLARKGVTVVCTTHTLDTLNFFDQLLVLGLKDRIASVVYFGSPHELLDSFGVHTQMDLFDKLQTFSGKSPAERDREEQAKAEADASSTRRKAKAPIRIAKAPPGKELLLQQAKVVFQRAYLSLMRDKISMFMAVAQPALLAVLIALAMSNQYKALSALFFTVVCSLWLGMNLTVREVVRERKLYIRDRLAGMAPDAYLAGKLGYSILIVAIQTTLLWMVMWVFGRLCFRKEVADQIGDTNIIAGWIVLFLAGIGAGIVGLMLSTVAKSERAAVAFLPLVLLPMVVLSRSTYGDIKKDWTEPSPYAAMLDTVRGESMSGMTKVERAAEDQKAWQEGRQPNYDVSTSFGQVANFFVSAPMLSRPASATMDLLGSKDEGSGGKASFEFFYLCVLVAGYGFGLYLLFHKLEKTWNDIRNA